MFFPITLIVLARFRVRLQWRKQEGAGDILCRQLPIVYHYGHTLRRRWFTGEGGGET